MVGRNDPCPCGSGKKYKACCLKKQQVVSMELPIKEDLKKCLVHFFEQYPTPMDWKKIREWASNQTVNLKKTHSLAEAEYIYADAYLYMHHLDLWHQYIEREIKKAVRPAVKVILEKWRTPTYMLLYLEEEQSDYFVAINALTGELVEIDKDSTLIAEKGDYIFGPFLNSSVESGARFMHISALVLSRAMTAPKAVWWMKSAFAKGSWKTEGEFFAHNLLACYEAAGKKDWSEDEELSDKDLDFLETVKSTLVTLDLNFAEILQVLKKYLQLEGYPKRLQKQEGFVAGVVLVGDTLRFYDLYMPRKSVVAYFNVSSSTANKYENILLDFYDKHLEEFRQPMFVIEHGTDPRASEYGQWNVVKHSETMDHVSEQDLMEHLNSLQNKPYIPNNKQELAQIFAYESYKSQSSFEKIDLANKAFEEDPQNVDALLLLVEQIKDKPEQRRYLEQAIRFGKQQFDGDMDHPWAFVLNRPYMRAVFKYAVWCFEEGLYEEALQQFEKLLSLNDNDNQGARFFAVACYIKLRLWNKAQQLLKKYHASTDAMTVWLEWTLLKQKNENADKVFAMFERAIELNPFVKKYMNLKQSSQGYPKYMTVKRQSPEEGQLIWYLLERVVD